MEYMLHLFCIVYIDFNTFLLNLVKFTEIRLMIQHNSIYTFLERR
jgi:hypothetical protein